MREWMQRAGRLLPLLIAAWVVMTMTHESGHVIAGWLGGAELKQAVVVPWRLPYSLHEPDPHPQFTLWGGPILGVLIPILAACLLRARFAWFIADFCLLANGGYLALAWLTGDRFLDTARMLQAGVSPLLIAGYCLVTIVVGYLRFRTDCRLILNPPNDNRGEG